MVKFLTVAVIAFVMVVLFAAIFSFVTQWAWSGTVVEIFHFPELSLLQAWKLNILGGMLFKSSGASTK